MPADARERFAIGTALATAFAMIAFAANSVLCRLALGHGSVDAASFTTLRLVSGAAMLLPLSWARRADPTRPAPSRAPWISGFLLFLYAAGFSFAYITLGTGTGALLLFGAVQATMILAALRAGERFRIAESVGLGSALAGLAVLVAPGVTAPSPSGSVLMIAAGVAWGIYSLRGRRSGDPLRETARNFAAAFPLTAILSLAILSAMHLSARGVLLAVLSGAVMSGLGYVVWYTALRGLTSVRAAIVQLSVPAIAALGGVVFLHERITLRLLVSASLILGGVVVAVVRRTGAVAPAGPARAP